MITVKNSQLTNDAVSILNELSNMNIKASVAFKLMRIIKDISIIIDDKLKAEKMVIDKWALKNENGEYTPIFDENGGIVPGTIKILDMTSFEKEMLDLLNVENTILHNKINFDELGLTDMVKVKDLMKIDFIFE